jgi:two-component system sensor histidine kinase/response regulator
MSTTNSNPSRPCLLLVDDTPSNIDVLVGMLKDDYDLKVANRGAKALKICEAGGPIDLVLLDVMMPEMDGYEVCRQLRATAATRDIPIIFLTAKSELEDVVHGFEIGANDYVAKPFRPAELRARVRTHLMIAAQQREIEAKNVELKEMLHIVCHDVGNQFAVLSMAVEIVTNHPELSLTKYLPRIAVAVRNGIGLTNLVRDLRRAEDKGLTPQPVPVKPALDEALLLAEDRLAAKQIELTAAVPDVRVLGEPFALTNSVFGNLISNAIKFSPRGSRIGITGEVQDGFVCLRFRDNGIGMPPAAMEHLFDVARSRSRPGTDGEKGTGFGMPLMHRFVTHFGGTVAVQSRDMEANPDDHGTEFVIRLRVAEG